MSNSLVIYLRGYIQALFLDFAWLYSSEKERNRDLSRLLSNLELHGSRTATIDLPAIGKAFEQALEVGYWTPPGIALSSSGRGTVYPKFLGSLFSKIFTSDGVLRSDLDSAVVFAIRQLTLSSKKLRIDCEKRLVYAEVSNFFGIEEDIPEPSLPWGEDSLGLSGYNGLCHTDSDRYASLSTNGRKAVSRLQRVSDIVSSQFGDLHAEGPHELPKHGPGVVSNAKRGESKYSFPEWQERLDRVFPRDQYVHQPFGDWSDGLPESMSWRATESPSKLIAVPKTQKGPRLIAAEPIQNQWIQQLLWSQLKRRLRATSIRSCVDFSSQDKNRILARIGSRDGTYCTIDLSSASDRLSCYVIERTFRANHSILERLNACRTPYLSNGIDKFSPSLVKVKKMFTQGNACTFPVQSIVYAIAAIAAVHSDSPVTARSIEKASTSVQVYGDDIIVPNHTFELMCELLGYLGLKVNVNKSFSKGSFRESCGGDYFQGDCVSPAYLLDAVTSASTGQLSSQIEVCNNFFDKGLWATSDYIRRSLRAFERFIPFKLSGSVGAPLSHSSFCGYKDDHLATRYNPNLHREEKRYLRGYSTPSKAEAAGTYKLMKFIHEPSDQSVRFDRKGRAIDPVIRILDTLSRGTSSSRPGWAPIYSPNS